MTTITRGGMKTITRGGMKTITRGGIVSKFKVQRSITRVKLNGLEYPTNADIVGGNRTNDLEVGPDRQTDSFIPQTTFSGGITKGLM